MIEYALLLNRLALGLMFASSGWHKLFVPSRREKLRRTLTADKVPFVRFNVYWVPANELVFGILTAVGLFAEFSAAVLGLISLIALIVDGLGRIKQWEPLDRADYLCCVLYLPETLLGILAVNTIAGGGGALSIT